MTRPAYLLTLCVVLAVVATEVHAQPAPLPGDRDAVHDRSDRPPPPNGPRDHDRRPPAPPMSAEETEQAIDIVRQIQPELADRLEAMRQEDPERVSRELDERFPRYRYLLRLKRYDPEMFELRVTDIRLFQEDRRLAAALREAQAGGDAAAIEPARAELHEHVGQHFEHRQRIRALELERLEQRLESLRQEIDQRNENRDELIDKYVDMLMNPRRGRGSRAEDRNSERAEDSD